MGYKLIRIHTDPHEAELGEYVYRNQDGPGPHGWHNWDTFFDVGENGVACAHTLGGWEFVLDEELQLWLRVA